MIIHVGSTNPTKINGVKNIAKISEILKNAEVVGVDANVEEFGHPKTFEDTVKGATERALQVFEGSDLSVGIESGMFVAKNTKSGYLETTACAIYDGERYYIGLGPSFEWPDQMTKLILAGQDGSQAFKTLGLTQQSKIGTTEGIANVLSKGKVSRTNLNELAFTMALIQLENPELY
jgi:inosine/xanthosine triphosphatase